VYSNQNEVLVT